VPEFIDQVFAKQAPKRSFSMTENERFGLIFAKTVSINSDTVQMTASQQSLIFCVLLFLFRGYTQRVFYDLLRTRLPTVI
jgi:hypothetical protein